MREREPQLSAKRGEHRTPDVEEMRGGRREKKKARMLLGTETPPAGSGPQLPPPPPIHTLLEFVRAAFTPVDVHGSQLDESRGSPYLRRYSHKNRRPKFWVFFTQRPPLCKRGRPSPRWA